MVLALTTAVLFAACTVEDARYQLRTAPEITATFRDVDSGSDWPSRLALRIHIGKTDRSYWFLPWSGGTDDRQNLASTKDVTAPDWHPPSPDGGSRPLGNLEYIATDAHYSVIDAIPRRNDAAPAHILLPGLGDALWHSTLSSQRDGAPKQFFDLVSCSSN